jgi:type IV pilus assembly protein PilO
MNDFLDKLSKVPSSQKVMAAVGLGLLVAVGYYFFFYDEVRDTLTKLDADYTRLEKERKEYERRKAEYLAFREEVDRLREEQKELLKVLPESSEIPSFLDSIHTQAALAGLEIESFTRKDEQPQDVYFRIPVDMEVVGTYHQIAKFAKIVGELKRIVNIENINLSAPTMRDGQMFLKANFVAATFRFKETVAAPRKSGGATPGRGR